MKLAIILIILYQGWVKPYVMDDEESLFAGICHICKEDSKHSIINIGREDFAMITIVVEQ